MQYHAQLRFQPDAGWNYRWPYKMFGKDKHRRLDVQIIAHVLLDQRIDARLNAATYIALLVSVEIWQCGQKNNMGLFQVLRTDVTQMALCWLKQSRMALQQEKMRAVQALARDEGPLKLDVSAFEKGCPGTHGVHEAQAYNFVPTPNSSVQGSSQVPTPTHPTTHSPQCAQC